jgi:CRP-like cAMP-binding protein
MIGPALIASIPHKDLIAGSIAARRSVCDLAGNTNRYRHLPGSHHQQQRQTMPARMGFCELFYRARASRLTDKNTTQAPITLAQLGETLGMAVATVNRTLQELRASRAVDFRNGELVVRNWRRLAEIGQFNPRYLHLKNPPL